MDILCFKSVFKETPVTNNRCKIKIQLNNKIVIHYFWGDFRIN